MTVLTPHRVAEQQSGSPRHGRGFWLIAVVYLVALAFSTVPTPLYPLYQRADGFSALTVTVVFAVYAIGVTTSLLLAGHISDWTGRRRVLQASLGLEILAGVLFLGWTALPGLIVARFLTGLGVGMLTATATVYLLELHKAHRPEAPGTRFEVVSSAANLGGLGAGTLVAGALAQFVASPLYAVRRVPVPAGARRRRRRRRARDGDRAGHPARVPAAGRADRRPAPDRRGRHRLGVRRVRRVRPVHLARAQLRGRSAAPPEPPAGRRDRLRGLRRGRRQPGCERPPDPARPIRQRSRRPGDRPDCLATGMADASLPLFLLGGAIAGAGAGILFKSAVGTIAAAAPAHQRGESLAGLFLIAYLGLVGPVLGLGLASHYVAATTSMLWFTGVLLALLGAVFTVDRWGTN